MTDEPRHRLYGETMSEVVTGYGDELEIDAVGIWQLVPAGRQGFGLEGDALTEFMRRCVKELLSRGAVPVLGGGDSEHDWIVQRRYGTQPDEILENVIAEWLANGSPNDDPGGLWFALPQWAWLPPE